MREILGWGEGTNAATAGILKSVFHNHPCSVPPLYPYPAWALTLSFSFRRKVSNHDLFSFQAPIANLKS
jgi:hypothetical protein